MTVSTALRLPLVCVFGQASGMEVAITLFQFQKPLMPLLVGYYMEKALEQGGIRLQIQTW